MKRGWTSRCILGILVGTRAFTVGDETASLKTTQPWHRYPSRGSVYYKHSHSVAHSGAYQSQGGSQAERRSLCARHSSASPSAVYYCRIGNPWHLFNPAWEHLSLDKDVTVSFLGLCICQKLGVKVFKVFLCAQHGGERGQRWSRTLFIPYWFRSVSKATVTAVTLKTQIKKKKEGGPTPRSCSSFLWPAEPFKAKEERIAEKFRRSCDAF